jgi:asparagine synthase (glutamine-hydrolysing)
MFRYVILMSDEVAEERRASVRTIERRLKAAAPNWRVEYTGPGLLLMVADPSPALGVQPLFGHAGVVIGECFERHSDLLDDTLCAHAVFDKSETKKVIDSRGRDLLIRYWGNFVALLADQQSDDGDATASPERTPKRYLLKEPTGTLPCYFTEYSGVRIVFSCLSDCIELGIGTFGVNHEFLAAWTVNGMYDAVTEPYRSISTVGRGECVCFDARGAVLSRSLYWSPSIFEESSELIEDADYAARALRATLRSCVHSYAAHHSRVLQETSGGLDSSIVLGCLGDAPNHPDITCYTNYIPDGPSDERRWARCAAGRKGHVHIEVGCDPAALDFRKMPALMPSVQPGSCMWHWQKGPTERNLASRYAVTAAFSGDGGDAILCSTSYVFAVDHCIRRYGLGRATFRTAVLVAMRRDRTVWNVLGKAISRRVLGTPVSSHRQMIASGLQLVDKEARKSIEAQTQFPNPWFQSANTLLETVTRLGTLAFTPNFYDLSVSHHAKSLYAIAPMCAQPVVELCLRIPVDIHFDSGKTRGLARRAFTAEVPAPILRRQWKDRPASHLSQVVQRNLAFLRETLLDGILAKERILDRAECEKALTCAPTQSRAIKGEILRHLDLELWARGAV